MPSESSNLPPIKENRLLVEPALAEYGMEAWSSEELNLIVAASFAIMFSKKDKGRTVEIVNETWICQIALQGFSTGKKMVSSLFAFQIKH